MVGIDVIGTPAHRLAVMSHRSAAIPDRLEKDRVIVVRLGIVRPLTKRFFVVLRSGILLASGFEQDRQIVVGFRIVGAQAQGLTIAFRLFLGVLARAADQRYALEEPVSGVQLIR